MTSDNPRARLKAVWGSEVVLQCCRLWLAHYADGRWGTCGLCREHPVLTTLKWEVVDTPDISRDQTAI